MLPWIQAIISFRVKPLILNCDSHARQGETKKQPDKVTRGSFIFQNPALKVSSMNSWETMGSQWTYASGMKRRRVRNFLAKLEGNSKNFMLVLRLLRLFIFLFVAEIISPIWIAKAMTYERPALSSICWLAWQTMLFSLIKWTEGRLTVGFKVRRILCSGAQTGKLWGFTQSG